MTRPDRLVRSPLAALGLVAVAALSALAPSRAVAESYDMDCKLILCLPAGFPSGCSDAFDHMMDRLRDGRSPIGVCAMSDGSGYDRYDIDYLLKPASSPQGWDCPAGKTLYHRTGSDAAGRRGTVNTFCYDTAHTRTGWDRDGSTSVTSYTDMTPPIRTDFWVNLTLEPGTAEAVSDGWQKFDTRRPMVESVRFTD